MLLMAPLLGIGLTLAALLLPVLPHPLLPSLQAEHRYEEHNSLRVRASVQGKLHG